MLVVLLETPATAKAVTVITPPNWVALGKAVFSDKLYVVGKVIFVLKVLFPDVLVKPFVGVKSTADNAPVNVPPVN